MTLLLFYLGLTLIVVGYAWLLAEAFRDSMFWGLVVLMPPLSLVYGLWSIRQHWRPTGLLLLGLGLMFGMMPAFGN